MNKERKIDMKIFIPSILILLIVAGYFYYNSYKQTMKMKEHFFMLEYLPEKAVLSIEKWSDYFDLDKWMVFKLLMTESNGKKYVKSYADCKGYMQLSESTANACKNRLYELIKWKHYNIYYTEINIASGCLHLANLRDNFLKEYDELKLIEIYNVGFHNYNNKRIRAPRHLKNYTINKTYFETRFKKWRMEVKKI
jgi:soluble lytic murein transglycosylase-like protein